MISTENIMLGPNEEGDEPFWSVALEELESQRDPVYFPRSEDEDVQLSCIAKSNTKQDNRI